MEDNKKIPLDHRLHAFLINYSTKLLKWFNRVKFEIFLWRIGGLLDGYYHEGFQENRKGKITSRYFFAVTDGWLPLIKNLIKELIEAGWDKKLCNVKEKFGSLRFHISNGNEQLYKIISKYEKISIKTCEICGNSGELRSGHWILTLCDKHADGRPKSTIKFHMKE